MATISQLNKPASEWGVGGTPLVSMMNLERRWVGGWERALGGGWVLALTPPFPVMGC